MLRKEGKQGGEMRYNVGRIAGRMHNIFGEIQPAREGGGKKKSPPRGGACLYDFTREATELFYISRTRASDFTNKMFGVLKQDVRSLNTILKVSQEQKDSEFEH